MQFPPKGFSIEWGPTPTTESAWGLAALLVWWPRYGTACVIQLELVVARVVIKSELWHGVTGGTCGAAVSACRQELATILRWVASSLGY